MIWPFKKKISNSCPPEKSEEWPKFDSGMQPIACWTNPDQTQRVFLIVRQDGLFSRWEEGFSDDEFIFGWNRSGIGTSFYDSEETAIREIRISCPWSRDIEPERRTADFTVVDIEKDEETFPTYDQSLYSHDLLHHIELGPTRVKYDGQRQNLTPRPAEGYNCEFSVNEGTDVKYVATYMHDGPKSIKRNGRVIYEENGTIRLYMNGHLLNVHWGEPPTVTCDGETKTIITPPPPDERRTYKFIVVEGDEDVIYKMVTDWSDVGGSYYILRNNQYIYEWSKDESIFSILNRNNPSTEIWVGTPTLEILGEPEQVSAPATAYMNTELPAVYDPSELFDSGTTSTDFRLIDRYKHARRVGILLAELVLLAVLAAAAAVALVPAIWVILMAILVPIGFIGFGDSIFTLRRGLEAIPGKVDRKSPVTSPERFIFVGGVPFELTSDVYEWLNPGDEVVVTRWKRTGEVARIDKVRRASEVHSQDGVEP